MANKTLNSRILIRNATAQEWSTSNPVLMKGEIGIENDASPIRFKVGDGSAAWGALPYAYNLTEILAQVDSKIEAALEGFSSTTVYEAECAYGADKVAALEAVATEPNKGDIGIVKEAIAGDAEQYTAYVYNGTAWAAMDGNYDAANVYFPQDLKLTYQFGKYTPDSTGSVTVPTSGKSLVEAYLDAYSVDANPTITQPSVSITLTGAGAKEVGTNFTPSYTVNFNAGSYQYGPATGVTVSEYAVTDTNSGSASTQTGSFTQFTVEEDTNYRCSAEVTYGDGAIPKTSLGNDYAAGQIKGGSKSAQSSVVTGYRGWFAGYYSGAQALPDATAITSAQLRAFGVRNGSFPTSMSTNQMQQMFFAAPTGVVSSVGVANSVNGAPQTVAKTTVQVEGANGYTAATYDLFYVANATAEGGASTFTITTTKA